MTKGKRIKCATICGLFQSYVHYMSSCNHLVSHPPKSTNRSSDTIPSNIRCIVSSRYCRVAGQFFPRGRYLVPWPSAIDSDRTILVCFHSNNFSIDTEESPLSRNVPSLQIINLTKVHRIVSRQHVAENSHNILTLDAYNFSLIGIFAFGLVLSLVPCCNFYRRLESDAPALAGVCLILQ